MRGQDKAKTSGIRSWNSLHTWANGSLLLQAIALPEGSFFDCLYFYWKKINSCSKVPNGCYTYVMQGASNGNDTTRDYLSEYSSICVDYKDRKNTIPSAHHMFGIPISLQTPSISPSEFIPQTFFIRLTTSSPQISRIWSDASPRLYFSVCEWKASRSRNGRKINPVAKTITSASSSDPFSNLRPDSVISDILLSFLSLIFLSIMSCEAPVSVRSLYPSWIKWTKGIPR